MPLRPKDTASRRGLPGAVANALNGFVGSGSPEIVRCALPTWSRLAAARVRVISVDRDSGFRRPDVSTSAWDRRRADEADGCGGPTLGDLLESIVGKASPLSGVLAVRRMLVGRLGGRSLGGYFAAGYH
jgi:hypothetical protein